jgi:hypothetical protein
MMHGKWFSDKFTQEIKIAHYNRENRLIAGAKLGSKGTNPELARRRELHAIEARFKAEEEI